MFSVEKWFVMIQHTVRPLNGLWQSNRLLRISDVLLNQDHNNFLLPFVMNDYDWLASSIGLSFMTHLAQMLTSGITWRWGCNMFSSLALMLKSLGSRRLLTKVVMHMCCTHVNRAERDPSEVYEGGRTHVGELEYPIFASLAVILPPHLYGQVIIRINLPHFHETLHRVVLHMLHRHMENHRRKNRLGLLSSHPLRNPTLL